MGKLAVMDRSGDMKVEWSAGNEAEVDHARQTFDAMKKKGYAAFKTQGDGSRGEQIREFDASAESIVMAPAMQGG